MLQWNSQRSLGNILVSLEMNAGKAAYGLEERGVVNKETRLLPQRQLLGFAVCSATSSCKNFNYFKYFHIKLFNGKLKMLQTATSRCVHCQSRPHFIRRVGICIIYWNESKYLLKRLWSTARVNRVMVGIYSQQQYTEQNLQCCRSAVFSRIK